MRNSEDPQGETLTNGSHTSLMNAFALVDDTASVGSIESLSKMIDDDAISAFVGNLDDDDDEEEDDDDDDNPP